MDVTRWLLWGFAATVSMTILVQGSQELGVTRVNMPYLLGTMFTQHRARAKALGIAMHLFNGWVFSLLYVLLLEAWGGATLWRGLVIGLGHVVFVLLVGFPALPGIHPRMASETAGPTARRQLEPPGTLGMHYGPSTPAVLVAAHLLFGGIIGAFY